MTTYVDFAGKPIGPIGDLPVTGITASEFLAESIQKMHETVALLTVETAMEAFAIESYAESSRPEVIELLRRRLNSGQC